MAGLGRFRPQTHRLKTSKISNDPHFADKVVDVVGLYLNPHDNALVLSVDEKPQIHALDRTQPMLPLRPGQVELRPHDYKRQGTASLYAAFDILTSQVIGRVTQSFWLFCNTLNAARQPDWICM